jgi:cobalamin synthase
VSFGRYVTIVLGLDAVSLSVLSPLAGPQPQVWLAIALGATLATVNTLVAFGLVRWSDARSNTAFFRAVIGGTLGRMAALLGAVAAAVVVAALPRLPLVISVLSYFVAFLVLELMVVHRTVGRRLDVAR